MLFIGITHTWAFNSGPGFNNRQSSTFFQVSEESLYTCYPRLNSGSWVFSPLVCLSLLAVLLAYKRKMAYHLTINSLHGQFSVCDLSSLQLTCPLTLIRSVISSVYPFLSQVQHSSPRTKIMTFFLAFSVCFVVLSISVEGLFYSAFTCNLLLWIEVETAVRKKMSVDGSTSKEVRSESYHFQADDVRTALFFLFFVQVAFFGTGKYVTFIPCMSVSHFVSFRLQRCIHIVSSMGWHFGAMRFNGAQFLLSRACISACAGIQSFLNGSSTGSYYNLHIYLLTCL